MTDDRSVLHVAVLVGKQCLVIGIVSFFPPTAQAQYWGEQVLEKSFEHTDFFFSPSYLNPYSLGGFGSSAVGLLSDPLLDVQINPAYLATDSLPDQYAYLDFRNTREIDQRGFRPYYGDYYIGLRSSYIGFPRYFATTRTEAAPVFSGAYIARLGGPLERLTLGATYQLVYQDERYYAVPQDIYRSNPEAAFAGDRASVENAIPIIDRYSGADGMQQRGHFAALYAAFRPIDELDVGIRGGRTTFSRDGEFGSHNLWPSSLDRESLRDHMEVRDQSYGHWDVSGGLNYRIAQGLILGVTGGYLWGDVSQSIAQQDTSFSRYRSTHNERQSTYIHSGFKNQDWFHEGSSYHAGVNIIAQLTPRTNVQAYVRRSAEHADIQLASALADTSYASSRYDWDSQIHEYESHSSVSDVRTGFGGKKQINSRAALYFHWSVSRATSVRIGANLTASTRTIQTEEDVTARRHSYYFRTDPQRTYEDRRATDEEKILDWDFESRVVGVQVPVYMSRRVSDVVELLFGINRRMTAWNISDVTLAVFDYRREIENEATELKEQFGERYTQPKERLTDVETALIAGVTITPAERFHIRVLLAPHFAEGALGTTLRDFQWWISLTATPGFRVGSL